MHTLTAHLEDHSLLLLARNDIDLVKLHQRRKLSAGLRVAAFVGLEEGAGSSVLEAAGSCGNSGGGIAWFSEAAVAEQPRGVQCSDGRGARLQAARLQVRSLPLCWSVVNGDNTEVQYSKSSPPGPKLGARLSTALQLCPAFMPGMAWPGWPRAS